MRLAPILQSFFTDRLVVQRQASANTISAYRDSLRLLLVWLADTTGTQPFMVDLGQLDAATIVAFLTYLQDERGNSTTTRNARLTAIRSLFRHAALQAPEHAELIARVLAIPPKRCDRTMVCFLTATEVEVLLAAPDRTRWHGRLLRDAVVGMGGDILAGTVVSRPRVVGAPPRCGGAGVEFAGCHW